MNKLFTYVHKKISSVILRLMDEVMDRRICGRSLVRYVPSVYRDDAAFRIVPILQFNCAQ